MQNVRPNQDCVASKVLEGEAILIHLVSGVYYSMGGVGAVFWELLQSGLSPRAAAAQIAVAYDRDLADVEADLADLLGVLLREDLVVPVEAETVAEVVLEELVVGSYLRPELEIYRDMGELLALDPPDPDLSLAPC